MQATKQTPRLASKLHANQTIVLSSLNSVKLGVSLPGRHHENLFATLEVG
jgi:hypothetical protein